MLNDRDVELLQVVCVSHPRQHEELGGVDGSAAQDHLFICKHLRTEPHQQNLSHSNFSHSSTPRSVHRSEELTETNRSRCDLLRDVQDRLQKCKNDSDGWIK